MRSALRVPLLALLLSCCGRPVPAGSTRVEANIASLRPTPAPAEPASDLLSADVHRPLPALLSGRPWIEALRMERWHEALSLIDAEPTEVRGRPDVRYACAAAAERIGDHARVLEHLAELEHELPLLADRIQERRARAALSAEDARVSLEFYRQRTDAPSRLKVAESLAALGDVPGARAALGILLAQLPKRGSVCTVEAKARKLLSELLPPDKPAPIARELRFLALSAPRCPSSAGVDDKLEQLGAAYALDKRERAERARTFADAGMIEAAERELAKMLKARGVGPDAATGLAIRGIARYQARSELDRGAELLLSAAAMNPLHAAEWTYTAARAHTRAGDTSRAIELFDEVRRKYPRTSLAEHADYNRAQLIYAAGRFPEAVQAYDSYLSRYGRRGRFSKSAEDERSVAWLVTGKADKAAASFAELARSTERLERARYTHLEGVAWLRSGDRARAELRLQEVVRQFPLSFAALASAARLESLGVAVPSLPAALAAETEVGELAVTFPPEADFLHRLGLDREAELALGKAEGAVKRSFSGQESRALCMLYRRLAPAERCYRVGQSAATWEELNVAPRTDRRWLWDCVYPRPYGDLVEQKARDHALDPNLIYAVMRQESGFRPEVVSPARAVGLLQILPTTGERLAREAGIAFEPEALRHPPVNVQLGAQYLRKLLNVFDGSLPLAVASYNAGPNAVLRWLDGANGLDVDLFVARIPYSETRAYVERVIGNYARYSYLMGGEGSVPRLVLQLPKPRTEGVELY